MTAKKKLLLLASLYFSQGLPGGFFHDALPILLRQRGVPLEYIGALAWLALPWALKFLWAPLLDRRGGASFARRRRWIVPLQLGSAAVLLALAALPFEANLPAVLVGVLVLNLFAATQDVATDGLAVSLLEPQERGLGNGIQAAGYRFGMVVAGGILLITFEDLGWSLTMVALALLMFVGVAPIALSKPRRAPEPSLEEAPESEAPARLLWQAVRRYHMPSWLAVLALYKLGDQFTTGMIRPLLVDLGYDMREIGWLLGMAGSVAAIVGAVAGGLLINRIGRLRALITFGVFQVVGAAGYLLAATGWWPGLGILYVVSSVEHLASGMATAALFTLMMDRCRPSTGGTDYTVQACILVVGAGLGRFASGFSAGTLGHVAHLALGAAFTIAVLLAIARLYRPLHHPLPG